MRKSVKAYRKQLKENGVFYTPKELALKMKSLLPTDTAEVYDPTCGDGGLLKVFDCDKYGAEIDPDEAAKARLSGITVFTGDTLEEHPFSGRTFASIVANPPFSVTWNPDTHKDDPTFAGFPRLPPKSRADYAFIAHILSRLTDDGRAVVLISPGLLYRGNAEGEIREYLVKRGCFERIERIRGGHFEDTSIETVLVTLRTGGSDHVLFVDGDKQRSVPLSEIEAGGDLSVWHYVQSDEDKKKPDPTVEDSVELELGARECAINYVRASIRMTCTLCQIDKNLPPASEFVKSLHETIDDELKNFPDLMNGRDV